jgi:hypothetical protein
MSKQVTNNTFYINELYIPHAKPSVTSDVTSISAELDRFILKYERECMLKCFGPQLFKEFYDEIDSTETNGLDSGADQKWVDLMNGLEYADPQNGKTISWRGLRFKESSADGSPTRSLLANYVYFFYEKNYEFFRTGIGHVIPKGKNVLVQDPAPKVVSAWNEMVEMIQGRGVIGKTIKGRFGVGVDFYGDNREVDLYKFIRDQRLIEGDDYYADFLPNNWERINKFDL